MYLYTYRGLCAGRVLYKNELFPHASANSQNTIYFCLLSEKIMYISSVIFK